VFIRVNPRLIFSLCINLPWRDLVSRGQTQMSQFIEQPFPTNVGRWEVKRRHDVKSFAWGYGAIAFCLVHVPLALLLYHFNVLSTFHALVVLGVGIWLALSAGQHPVRVAYVGAYIMGAEVLWRMTHAEVNWEFAKYATALVFLIAILRQWRFTGPSTIFGYFALLLPSIVVIVARIGIGEAQEYISFNLSGPLALMVAAWFFSELKLTVTQIQRIFLIATGPIIGIATITVFGIYTAEEISFTGGSNLVSSGGFGPNQVSAALGLGALVALMFVVLGKTNSVLRFLMFGAMIFMAVQSALTFSRGGLYNFAGSIVFSCFYLLRDTQTRRILLISAAIVFLLGSFIILPTLQDFTDGGLGSRFSNTATTNRMEIIWDDLQLWQENPFLGVGPGGSNFAGTSTAHTEFARLFAEHGTFGVAALFLLLLSSVVTIRKTRTLKGKAIAVCMIAWSFLFMLNAAMRLVAPAFVFGLAFATVLPETISSLKAMQVRARRVRLSSIAVGRTVGSRQIIKAIDW
jgi:hypothetical protein